MAGRPDLARSRDYESRLDAIEAEIKAARLPNWLREQAYLLRAAIALVRERLGAQGAADRRHSPNEPRDDADLGTPSGQA